MTLADPPPFVGLEDSRAASLVRLREAVAPILANNLLPHFTDHSVEHSDNLIRLLHELTAPLTSTAHPLNADELVILYSACYLHDVGMQYEHIFELDVVPKSERCVPWQDLSDRIKRDVLRKYHHVASAKLVQLSTTTVSPPIGLVLSADYQPARVAALCEAHCLDTDCDRYRELTAQGPNLRMDLLSGLLRMVDILDESRRRATRERARTLDLDLVSQTHWWRHYYTENVTFDPREKMICLHFDFPRGWVDEYARVVPELQLPWVKAELERHRVIFGKNDLAWNVTHRVGSLPYSTTGVMPDTVLTQMVKELRRRRVQESDTQRAADLKAFDEAQPLLQRQRDELKEQRQTLPPADHLRRLHAYARDRWELGGTRAACMMLRFEFERDSGQLPPAERVTMAVELAGWLRMDGQADAARHILELVQEAVGALTAPNDLAFGYWRLLARCANESAAHPLGDMAIERAIPLAKTTEQRIALRAEHLEWRYLRGDLPEAPGDPSGADADTTRVDSEAIDDTADAGDGFLCQLRPRVRFAIVRCRLAAHLDDADQALKLIETIRDAAPPQVDRIAADLCRAEILFLDGRADQALQALDELAASVHQSPSDLELTILDDRTLVRFAELQVDADFYERHDRRRLHGITFWNESAVLDGMIDADRGRHYDAVPAFWAQVCHTYQRMIWQGQTWAHGRLAREFLSIGCLAEATWHSMLALDAATAKQIGAAVRVAGDTGLVRTVVDRLLRTARLRRHAQIACVIFGEVLDLVPDDQVAQVSSFVCHLAAQQDGDRGLWGRLEAAWTALTALIPRVDDESRGRFVRLAIEHPAWRNASPQRRYLIRIAHRAAARGIPEAVRTDLVEAALSLATKTRSDMDYSDALNLLCQLAQDGSSKERIGAMLFPPDGGGGNILLGQIAPLFGKHVTDADAVAREACRQIRLQVQRLAADQEPEKLGYFTVECTRDNQKVAVCVGAGEQHLGVVRRHKHRISDSACTELVDAILAMTAESDNDLSNRARLVDALRDLADRLDEPTARRVAATLRPLAEGQIVESSVLMTAAEAQHPLSRVSIKSSTPGQLRGLSLLALAEALKHHPGIVDESLDGLMAAALTDVAPEVRRFAYAAARGSPSLSTGALSAVLVGTQDSDSTVSRIAWNVLAEWRSPRIPVELWDTVVLALRKATRHRDPSVRQAAAAAGANLLAFAADVPPIGRHVDQIVAEFRRDPHHSVRYRALSPRLEPEHEAQDSTRRPDA